MTKIKKYICKDCEFYSNKLPLFKRHLESS